MKNTIKSILSTFLALALIFTVAGCGGTEEPAINDDDFFADTENVLSGSNEGNDSTGNQIQGDSQTQTGSNVQSDNSSNNQTSKPSNTGSTTGGKSWIKVLSSMPKKLRGTTIEMYNWNPPNEYGNASALMEKFTKETGIKVKWTTADFNTYQTKLASRVASDDAPDFARTNRPLAYNMMSFQPLSAAKYDFTDAAWDQTLMKDYSVNGKVYATSLNNTYISSWAMMFYNKAVIDKYDLENPYQLWKKGKWTYNKFMSMCEEFKKASGKEYAAGSIQYSGIAQIFGIGGPYSYNGKKYYSMLDDSKFLKVTQDVVDLYNTDKTLLHYAVNEFDNGEMPFWIGSSIYARRMNSYFKNLKGAGTLYCVPMPSVDGQKTYYQGVDEYEAYALIKGAKNPEAVPYFLRYFLDPENYDSSSFFVNSQAVEVHKWCAEQKNKLLVFEYWDKLNPTSFDAIRDLKGNQVKSFVDSNENVINQRVKELNDALKKLS
ncbi:MAG: extracellular solute-binding protein [Clostridia bacterium]|nr:extracellular solute-binding protein [Clostridia bacterium]